MEKYYDFIVIGGGLEGILVSALLGKSGHSVMLLESSSKVCSQTNAFFNFLPDTDEAKGSLSFLNKYLDLKVAGNAVYSEPVTFEKGGFQPFVGFGETAPDCFDWIKNSLLPKQLNLNYSHQKWVQVILEQNLFEVNLNSTVTSVERDEYTIKSVVVNGKIEFKGSHIVSTVTPTKLVKWNKQLLSTKLAQKWNKAKLWSTLVLELTHDKKISDRPNLHLLTSANNIFCMGLFDESSTSSKWMSFVSAEDEPDTEKVGTQIRDMKKLISKAYPNSMNNLAFEKLTVYSQSHGHIPYKMNQENPLSPLKNLWLCNAKLTQNLNVDLGVIEGVRELIMDYELHGYLNKSSNSGTLGGSAASEISP